MQSRRKKRLCYTCDDNFTLTHKCPNKQYLLFQYEETLGPLEKQTRIHNSLIPTTLDPLLDHHLFFNTFKSLIFALAIIKFWWHQRIHSKQLSKSLLRKGMLVLFDDILICILTTSFTLLERFASNFTIPAICQIVQVSF